MDREGGGGFAGGSIQSEKTTDAGSGRGGRERWRPHIMATAKEFYVLVLLREMP